MPIKRKPSKKRSQKSEKRSKKSRNIVGDLSWTKVDTIEKSEKQYTKSYVYGRRFHHDSMDFGSVVTEALEGRNEKDLDVILQAVKTLVPTYPRNDVAMESFIVVDGVKRKVWGKLDGWDGRKMIVGEYKTSLYPWSRQKAIDHGQMKVYAWFVWKNKGKIPQNELTWLETTNDNDEYAITGNFLTHKWQYTLKDMLEIEVRLIKAYKKIEKLLVKELDL